MANHPQRYTVDGRRYTLRRDPGAAASFGVYDGPQRVGSVATVTETRYSYVAVVAGADGPQPLGNGFADQGLAVTAIVRAARGEVVADA